MEDIHPDVQTVQDPDHRELPVDLLRSLRQDAYIRPNDGAAKVYIFPDCDALNQRDQNVLLKLVEEGPPYAAFLFCTETAATLLPTIRSRCVEWKLRGGDEDARDDTARDLCRVFASGQLLPVSQYLVGLENKRLKREQLQQLLEAGWRRRRGPAGRLWKAGPGGYPRGGGAAPGPYRPAAPGPDGADEALLPGVPL